MADTQVGAVPEVNVVDKRRTPNQSTSTFGATYKTAMTSISDMRAALATLSGTRYPASYLNTISMNDMAFALRQELEPTSF